VFRRIPVLAARRRVLALVAVLGAGAAMLAASPAAPASAASAGAAPGAPDGGTSVTITAYPVSTPSPGSSGGVSPAALNGSRVTCVITADPPLVDGSNSADWRTTATAQTRCTYDFNGSPAPVQQIDQTETLYFNGVLENQTQALGNDTGIVAWRVSTSGCLQGLVQNDARNTVVFGPDYNPPTWSGRTIASSSIVQCPGGNPVGCAVPNGAITCSGSGGAAEPAADAVDPLPRPAGR
jgi:hypothetical protein